MMFNTKTELYDEYAGFITEEFSAPRKITGACSTYKAAKEWLDEYVSEFNLYATECRVLSRKVIVTKEDWK